MGYGVTAYRVKLEQLSSLFKNTAEDIRAEAIRLGTSKHCKNTTIVKELVEEGKASDDELGHEYLYAIEGMIGSIGIHLPARHWSPISVNTYGLLEEDFDDITKLMPFTIPEPDDFPWVLVLQKDNISADLSARLKRKLNNDSLYEELQNWITEASNNNSDLILYLY